MITADLLRSNVNGAAGGDRSGSLRTNPVGLTPSELRKTYVAIPQEAETPTAVPVTVKVVAAVAVVSHAQIEHQPAPIRLPSELYVRDPPAIETVPNSFSTITIVMTRSPTCTAWALVLGVVVPTNVDAV
jgi:hypothetical protein